MKLCSIIDQCENFSVKWLKIWGFKPFWCVSPNFCYYYIKNRTSNVFFLKMRFFEIAHFLTERNLNKYVVVPILFSVLIITLL